MVLMAGISSIIAYPNIIQQIVPSLHRPKPKRAQSMTIRHEIDPEFLDFENECAQYESHRQGLLLQIETDPRYQQLQPRPKQQRRIHSAPQLMMKSFTDEFTLHGDDDDCFENWDEDFDNEDLSIPQYILKNQLQFQSDKDVLLQFNQSIISETRLMIGLQSRYQQLLSLQKSKEELINSQKLVDQITMLLHLADYREELGSNLSHHDYKILSELLMLQGFKCDRDIVFESPVMRVLLDCVANVEQELVRVTNQVRCS